jgi:uncharacterized protein (DUF2249 family)
MICRSDMTYNDKVFKRLHELKQGEEIDLTKDAKGRPASESSRKRFIEAVEIFVYCQYDHFYGYVIEANQEKTRVRKNGHWK